MTEAMAPPLKGHFNRTQTKLACKSLERIKTSLNLAVMDHLLRFLILDQKIPWVKFKKDMIIKSEAMNRNKVLVCSRYMKNIV
jgi:hypothetical protein